MKYVVTDNEYNLLPSATFPSLSSHLQTSKLATLSLLTLGLLTMGMTSNASAASQGRLGSESSGSIGITLTIPDNLKVTSEKPPKPNQVNTKIRSHSGLEKTLCVQGVGVDHYSLSVSGSTGELILSNGKDKDIPYQVTWNANGEKVIIPADSSGDKLIIKTDSCDKPASVNVDISDSEALSEKDHSGAAILNLSAE